MTREELWARLERYAGSYLPQWRYNREGREPESALFTALGLLLEEAREQLDSLPDRLEEEFLSGFGLEAQGGGAARAYAGFTAPEETLIPAGSEFYLGGDGTQVWTTEGDVWASPIRLTAQLMSGGRDGKLIPLPGGDTPAKLFDFSPDGSQRRAVRFTHPDAFASRQGCQVELSLEDASDELMEFLCGRRSVWSLEGEAETVQLPLPRRDGQKLCFTLPAMSDARSILAQVNGIPPAGRAGRVRVNASRPGPDGKDGLSCDAVLTDEGAAEEGEFLPFGADVMPWKMCELACGDALGLRGAQVTVSWSMAMAEREELLPGQEREPEYKPVMRSMPPEPPEVRDVWADRVAWEYWNGGGWRSVPETRQYAGCFGPPDRGAASWSVTFPWPEDAEPCQEQGTQAYWLRWRVLAAEGAGWLPRRSHAPSVSNVRFSARLSDGEVQVESACGMADAPFVAVGPKDELFPPLTGSGDEWWLCFDRPAANGVLELYLTFSGVVRGTSLSAWEHTAEGTLHPLSMRDETAGLSHSGLISLFGITGQLSSRFGRNGWWMCLRDEDGRLRGGEGFPLLTGLSCGAARVRARGDDACVPGDVLQPMRGGGASGTALTGSFGRRHSETGDRQWARETRHHLGRGLSQADIEQLLRGSVAGVARVRCARTADAMEVAVLMEDISHHESFALQEEEIRRVLLERTVLPALGLEVRLREPRFYFVHVSLWVVPGPGKSFQQVRRVLLDALEVFLHPVTGGFRGKGWRLGALPSLVQLRSCLASAAPGVELMNMSAAVTTPEGREQDPSDVHDSLALPANGTHSIYEWKGGVR